MEEKENCNGWKMEKGLKYYTAHLCTHVGNIKQWVSFSRLSLTGHSSFWADLPEEKSASSPTVWAVKVQMEQSHIYNCAEKAVISGLDPPPNPPEEQWAAANHALSLVLGRRVDIHITYGLFVQERAGVQAFVMTFMYVSYFSTPG